MTQEDDRNEPEHRERERSEVRSSGTGDSGLEPAPTSAEQEYIFERSRELRIRLRVAEVNTTRLSAALDARLEEIDRRIAETRAAVAALEEEAERSAVSAEVSKTHRLLMQKQASAIFSAIRKIARHEDILSDHAYQQEIASIFDAKWYLANYPDVRSHGMDALTHFIVHGAREGRSPGPYFDSQSYLEANPDVDDEGMNPLLHFLHHGVYEQRPLVKAKWIKELRDQKGNIVSRPVKPDPRFWFYVGDSLDWLDANSHLTGVGRVSMELFFAAADPKYPVFPCVDADAAGLVPLCAEDRLALLAKKSGQPARQPRAVGFTAAKRTAMTPEPGDHVFFTGLCWMPSFIQTFEALSAQKIDFSVLVHDIIPLENPELVGDAYFRAFAAWLKTTLLTAEIVFVSTGLVKEHIARWSAAAGISVKPKIVPITFGLRPIPIHASPEAIIVHAKFSVLSADGFVLSVGTIDARKNQILLCRVWKALVERLGQEQVPQLVLVGRQDMDLLAAEPSLGRLFEDHKILVLQGLSDEEVSALYQLCLFTAFASTSEGHGLPVGESLQYGKLCLSSDLAVVREHAGDLAWYFATDDLESATALFLRALQNPADREAAQDRLRRTFKPSKWADTKAAMLKSAAAALKERVELHESDDFSRLPTRQADPRAVLSNARRWCVSEDPDVSIVIVNRNDANQTLRAIRNIWMNTDGRRYEIIIVDNGSRRDDIARVSALGAGIRLIDIGCDRFFGEANNIAAEAAQGGYLCLMSNHVLVEPGWLESLLSPLEADPRVGATGPRFLFANGAIQEACTQLDPDGYRIGLRRENRDMSSTSSEPKAVDCIPGAALLIRRETFIEAGGFDLAYEPLHYEDVDLCLKLKALDRTILYCPASHVVRIEEGAATNDNPAAEQRRKALDDINRNKLVARWGAYLESRDPRDLVVVKEQVLAPTMPPRTEPAGRKKAIVYTAYMLTPGGGERYLLTLASILARRFDVTVVTSFVYSQLRLKNLGQELMLDLSSLQIVTDANFPRVPSPHVMVTLGNSIIPPVKGEGDINIYICQFPFPMEKAVSRSDAKILSSYHTILSYSAYTAAHIYSALSADKLAKLPVRTLHPPVRMFDGAVAGKRPMILSVGRFFIGQHTKRHDALIEAFKNIYAQVERPVELHLAGSSTPSPDHIDYLASLREAARGYPIYFHVNCSNQELELLYRDTSVYWHGAGLGTDLSVKPSAAEHFGISLVEAMSAQAVCFALNAGGPREIIDHGVTGFLYSSVEELEQWTLETFSASNHERTIEMMRAAGERAHDFSEAKFEAGVDELIDGSLESPQAFVPRPGALQPT